MITPQPKDFAEAGRDIDSALGLSELDEFIASIRARRDRLMKGETDCAPSPELRAAQIALFVVSDALVEAREQLISSARDLIPAQAARLAQQRAEELEEAA